MKHLLFPALLLTAFAGLAVADTFLNKRFTDTDGGHNTLTISSSDHPGTINIPSGSTILVYDSMGHLLDPQPRLTVSPTLGTDRDAYKITDDSGDFPTGGTVVVSSINTSGTGDPPTGNFGHN